MGVLVLNFFESDDMFCKLSVFPIKASMEKALAFEDIFDSFFGKYFVSAI